MNVLSDVCVLIPYGKVSSYRFQNCLVSLIVGKVISIDKKLHFGTKETFKECIYGFPARKNVVITYN